MFNLFSSLWSFSSTAYIPEMEQKIGQLERGTLVMMYFFRRKAERKTMAIRRETRQLIWTRPASTSKPALDGTINLSEVKEIRQGTVSKDFEKCQDDIKNIENKCFVVYYGNEFKLNVLSVAAFSKTECLTWISGLKYLVADTLTAPYPLHVQNWLRREFYAMQTPREKITLKDLKSFFPKKIANNLLRDLFNEIDTAKKGEICFDDFANLYQKIILEEGRAGSVFNKLSEYSANFRTLNLPDVVSFFINEQEEPLGNDDRAVAQFIFDFLKDPQRETQEPFLMISEFVDFLFSKWNDLWDPKMNTVYQDMSKPLSHYWISSSHNTYLTGDQWSSESSVEAYVRCLRMGCRCIELDCWDGPDGSPIIYHGHTLTSKINFIDVIKIIKEHAFATSHYPVILSIEDNCTVIQQKKLASDMQEVFGDMLLTQPVENGETKLPSPYVLRRKIILKHKKLPDGQDESSFMRTYNSADMDLRNSLKNGIMYLKEATSKEWIPHFFVLTSNKLFYFGNYKMSKESDIVDDEEDADSFPKLKNNVVNDESHFGEKWFHGNLLSCEADQLLRAYAHLGDGTFLVRKNLLGKDEYRISFWRNGKPNHCRIKCKKDQNQIKYYLTDGKYFDSLDNLIKHYSTSPIVSRNFSITLHEPVPQPNLHENEEWYHKNTSKNQAEDTLKRTNVEGAFLVRCSENDSNCYTISFIANQKIKHCRVKSEGRLYTIGNMEFENLVSLIKYFQTYPLYKKVKLTEPISENTVQRVTLERSNAFVPTTSNNTRDTERCESRDADDIGGESGMQKSIDIDGALVSCTKNQDHPLKWIIRIKNPRLGTQLECAIKKEELAQEWCEAILKVSQRSNRRASEELEQELVFNIAKEISNLIVYCQSKSFDPERAIQQPFVFYEMSSFSETKAERFICQQMRQFFLKYHQHQFSRVYPKGQRFDSSNYNPINLWNCGSQMVALNFQTGDKFMQLNQSKFRDNGNCGYLLKPDFMLHENFDPYDKSTLVGVEPLKICIRVIAGRHLCRLKKGSSSPFVEIEVIGAVYDSGVKLVTKHVLDNGLNPVWTGEICEFIVTNPNFALLRFLVQDEDVFGESNFIGQATYPVKCLRTGYRSVWLKNAYSEDLELSSLLIHISIKAVSLD